MNVLVIGSGGREHALVWKLSQSLHVSRLWCAPGNAGVAAERLTANGELARCVDIAADDLAGLAAFASENRASLTVVGPDNPLAIGVVDVFRERGLRIWGPSRQAAQFEASKVFAQRFMERYGIPTARSGTFREPAVAMEFARSLGGCCAVKADGLALGKGVLLCRSEAESVAAIESILVRRDFGNAGEQIVIQELLEGTEISLHALCDGKTALLFPTAQDHKRALDGDQGLNTGGMGTYSPTPFLDQATLERTGQAILEPFLQGCARENIEFQGILYPGVMLTGNGPRVLEFNARFGDPETQVYLPRLENDLLELIEASIAGTLDRTRLSWSPTVAVCVVMASAGYPGTYARGKLISGLAEVARLPNVKVFHAATTASDTVTRTSGGRVLGVTAWAGDLRAARAAAYAAVDRIHFDGAHFRKDVAQQALSV